VVFIPANALSAYLLQLPLNGQYLQWLPALKLFEAAPLIKEMLIAVDKELYARAEVRTVEGVRLVEGRNQRSWKFDEDEILLYFSC
jgi:hypothetical protein